MGEKIAYVLLPTVEFVNGELQPGFSVHPVTEFDAQLFVSKASRIVTTPSEVNDPLRAWLDAHAVGVSE